MDDATDPSDPSGTTDPSPALPDDHAPRVVTASRLIEAPAGVIFALLADPARQVEWDGNDNLGEAASGQRVRGVGDVFTMALTSGALRENHVVDFAEGRWIAWLPAPQGEQPPGHLWRWDLDPRGASTLVTHTYDWTDLQDPQRQERARATGHEQLQASLDRLAALAEAEARRA